MKREVSASYTVEASVEIQKCHAVFQRYAAVLDIADAFYQLVIGNFQIDNQSDGF